MKSRGRGSLFFFNPKFFSWVWKACALFLRLEEFFWKNSWTILFYPLLYYPLAHMCIYKLARLEKTWIFFFLSFCPCLSITKLIDILGQLAPPVLWKGFYFVTSIVFDFAYLNFFARRSPQLSEVVFVGVDWKELNRRVAHDLEKNLFHLETLRQDDNLWVKGRVNQLFRFSVFINLEKFCNYWNFLCPLNSCPFLTGLMFEVLLN